MRAKPTLLMGVIVSACASVPRERVVDGNEVYQATCLVIRQAFDTGPSWWTDPDKECPAWSAALQIARQMAGCSEEYIGAPAHKCQVIIRKCSPGCDICRNLKPGEGPDTDFGMVRQGRDGTSYAATDGPYLFGGYDTRFDRARICDNARQLAKVMIHEAMHACRAAGGSKDLYDSYDPFDRGTPGCYSDLDVGPFEGDRECGDPR